MRVTIAHPSTPKNESCHAVNTATAIQKEENVRRFIRFAGLITTCLLLAQALYAQNYTRAKGIGLRGSFWRSENGDLGTVQAGVGEDMRANISFSGLGASLYYFTRSSPRHFYELGLGSIANAEISTSLLAGENVDFSGVAFLNFGMRRDLLAIKNESSLRPYFTFGLGSYWLFTSDIQSGNILQRKTNDIKLTTAFKTGTYAGGGLNMYLASWLAFNFDFRYHFVDFKATQNYSGPVFSIGLNLLWGKKQELFQVKEVKLIVKDLYPAYHQFYATYPLAYVRVKNIAGYPIELNVRTTVQHFSERAQNSGFIRLRKNETRDVEVFALFGEKFVRSTRRRSAMLDVVVEARSGHNRKKEFSQSLFIHNKNAWDGELNKLGFFITPDDDKILKLTRRIARRTATENSGANKNMALANALFTELKKRGIRYQHDPNVPFNKDDRVQFATETLDLETGDCDDLVVLYASMLQSLGIRTALVDVQDPDKDVAHLYLIFDTGISPEQAETISSNEKKYIIRESSRGEATVWVPVETTLLRKGFEQAWNSGALQYVQDGVLRGGVAEKWVRIVELD